MKKEVKYICDPYLGWSMWSSLKFIWKESYGYCTCQEVYKLRYFDKVYSLRFCEICIHPTKGDYIELENQIMQNIPSALRSLSEDENFIEKISNEIIDQEASDKKVVELSAWQKRAMKGNHAQMAKRLRLAIDREFAKDQKFIEKVRNKVAALRKAKDEKLHRKSTNLLLQLVPQFPWLVEELKQRKGK